MLLCLSIIHTFDQSNSIVCLSSPATDCVFLLFTLCPMTTTDYTATVVRCPKLRVLNNGNSDRQQHTKISEYFCSVKQLLSSSLTLISKTFLQFFDQVRLWCFNCSFVYLWDYLMVFVWHPERQCVCVEWRRRPL